MAVGERPEAVDAHHAPACIDKGAAAVAAGHGRGMQDRIELPGTAPGRYGAAGFDGSQRLYHVLQIKTLRPVHGAGLADGGNRLPILHRAGIACIRRTAALLMLNKSQVIPRRIRDELDALALDLNSTMS